MAKNRGKKRPPLAAILAREIEIGKKNSRDPQNAILTDQALRVTTRDSYWNTTICVGCEFRFREEDLVRLCPHCDLPLHDDDRFGLNCWPDYYESNNRCPRCRNIVSKVKSKEDDKIKLNTKIDSIISEGVYNEFTAGVKQEWSAFGQWSENVKVQKVINKEDPAYGKNCPMCRSEIRLGDQYIASPCGCGAYFHSDILRHLNCWNIRYSMNNKNYCVLHGLECPKDKRIS